MAQALNIDVDLPVGAPADDDEVVIPPPPSLLEQIRDSFRPNNLVASLIAGSVTGIIGVTGIVALASLLFAGTLSEYASVGMGFFLFGAIVISATSSLFSSTTGVVAGILDSGVAVLGVMVVALTATVPAGTSPR